VRNGTDPRQVLGTGRRTLGASFREILRCEARILKVILRGDTIALGDIRVLGEANYGENREGKSAPLTERLRYIENDKASKRTVEASG
jgi:hypothetical protein